MWTFFWKLKLGETNKLERYSVEFLYVTAFLCLDSSFLILLNLWEARVR